MKNNMANEFDLSLSPTLRRSAPTKGRRANQTDGLEAEEDEPFTSGSPLGSRPISGELFLDDGDSMQRGRPPPRGRRTG